MNSVNLIGRLGRDPETRYTGGGKAVCNFSIAVDDGFGENKQTYWFPIVTWEKTAELAQQYLVKGSQVAISGQLKQRSYEDRSGKQVTVIEIVARQVDFLSKTEKKGSSHSEQDEVNPSGQDDDDIPF